MQEKIEASGASEPESSIQKTFTQHLRGSCARYWAKKEMNKVSLEDVYSLETLEFSCGKGHLSAVSWALGVKHGHAISE